MYIANGPTVLERPLWGIDPDALEGKMPAFLPDVDTVREDFADYLGEVVAFDAGLGGHLKDVGGKRRAR